MKLASGWVTYGAVLLIGLAVLSLAPALAEGDENPSAGIARVSLIRSTVYMKRGDSGNLVTAKIDMALLRGDRVFTAKESQAEIQLDGSNVMRLAPGAEVQIAKLTQSTIRVQIARGLVTYTILSTNEADIELDTPNMAVRPIKEGSYRIQVTSPTETQLIVRKGDADVTTPQGTASVDEGCIIMVRGGDDPEYLIAKAPDPDDWDEWNGERDKQIQNSRSTLYARRHHTDEQVQYAPPLDTDEQVVISKKSGVSSPDYGEWCLTPIVNAGLNPYSPDEPLGSSNHGWFGPSDGARGVTLHFCDLFDAEPCRARH